MRRPERPWPLRLAALAIGLAVMLYAGGLIGLYALQRTVLYTGRFAPAATGLPAPIQPFTLRTADGETLAAWFSPPMAPDAPIFVMFDGNGGDSARDPERWRQATAQGAGLLMFHYRGYAGSTGEPTEAGLLADGRAAYDWAAARYPASRIVIHGFSLGSGVAVRVAAERPARALVLEAPFTSTVDVAAWRFPMFPVSLLMQDRFESIRWIGRVRMPLLVVHGEADATIPIRFGRALFARARAPKTFVGAPGAGHNGLVRAGLYDHVWTFLDNQRPSPANSTVRPAP